MLLTPIPPSLVSTRKLLRALPLKEINKHTSVGIRALNKRSSCCNFVKETRAITNLDSFQCVEPPFSKCTTFVSLCNVFTLCNVTDEEVKILFFLKMVWITIEKFFLRLKLQWIRSLLQRSPKAWCTDSFVSNLLNFNISNFRRLNLIFKV